MVCNMSFALFRMGVVSEAMVLLGDSFLGFPEVPSFWSFSKDIQVFGFAGVICYTFGSSLGDCLLLCAFRRETHVDLNPQATSWGGGYSSLFYCKGFFCWMFTRP